MRINKEDLEKLNQQSRIEFYLERNWIEEQNKTADYVNMIFKEIKDFVIFMGWSLIALPIWYLAFGSNFLGRVLPFFTSLRNLWIFILIIVTIGYFIGMLINRVKYNKLRKGLFDKYFKIIKNKVIHG